MQLANGVPSFLDLPWEIRDQVYSALLECEEPISENIAPQRTDRPLFQPRLTTAEILRCNSQIHDELQSKMKLWQQKGWARYKLHTYITRYGRPARIWTRVPVPLQYIHTLQLDIRSHGMAFYSREFPMEVHRMVLNFFDFGPELIAPHKLKFWPLLDTVLINIEIPEPNPASENVADIELDDPSTAQMPSLLRAAVTDLLYSYHFDEFANLLGFYIRTMKVRCHGYMFERLVEPDMGATADVDT